jgi:hypothetical protein
MATKSPALTDPDYQARLEEAYQKLVESLDQRKNRFFDPTYLAAAQAFATPTKTGSAFEALGNVAGAVGKSQEQEFKQNIEENKARFDINKELLAIEQQRKNQAEGIAALRGEAPTPPTTAPEPVGALPGPQPAGGALTSPTIPKPTTAITQTPLTLEPQGGGLPPLNVAQAPGAAEPAPQMMSKPAPPPAPLSAPPQAQVSPAQEKLILGMTPAGQKIAELAFRQGVPIQDAIKRGQEHDAAIQKRINDAENLRIEREKLKISQGELGVKEENLVIARDEAKIKQGQLDNAIEGTTQGNYKVVGSALVDLRTGKPVYISGGSTLKIGNGTYKANPDQADAFVNASRTGDTKTVQRIGSEVMGLTGEPGVLPVKSEEQKEEEKADRDAKRDAEKSATIKRLEEEDKKQRELINKIPKFESQRDNATTAIQILGDKEVQKVLGPLAGPGVVKAVGTIISGGLRVGSYNVALANFDEALINIKASPATRVKIDALRTAVRTEELINAQTYLKGDGPITNMERGLVQEMGGMVNKDPAAALLFKIQLSYAQAAVNERYAKSFEVWHDKNPTGTVADFNRSSTYQKIRSDYLVDLESIRKDIGVVPATAAPENKSVATRLRELVKSNANKLP